MISPRTTQTNGKPNPRPSFASSLTSLADAALDDKGADRQYRRTLADFITSVEKILVPSGIRFPDGTIQSTGLNPFRRASQSLSPSERKLSRRVEDTISLFLSI